MAMINGVDDPNDIQCEKIPISKAGDGTTEKRPWAKPSIKILQMVTTNTGTASGPDEDTIISDGGSDNWPSGAVARYSPSG